MPKKDRLAGVKRVYEKEYKKLLLIPALMLVLAIAQIGFQIATTGDFVNKGVSLKGGLIISIPVEEAVFDLEEDLESRYPDNDITVRTLSVAAQQTGVIVEIDMDIEDKQSIDELLSYLSQQTQIPESNINVKGIGSSLSASFFKDMVFAIIIAFIFMGFVVFLYFRTVVPSLAVILAAFSDMVVTLAIINLLDIKLSTAGIAAFLMLIGYSVDTDVLLSVRVLKRKGQDLMERVYSAVSTGLTMNITTIVAVSIAMIVTQSEIIKQIMTILLIGLLVDMINTWFQNVGILRMYLEKKGR